MSSLIHRWLGLLCNLCSAELYVRSIKLHLPISGLDAELMVSHTREAMLYQDSKDARVASASIVV